MVCYAFEALTTIDQIRKSEGQENMHYSCSGSESQIEPCQRTDCEKLERICRGAGARRVLGILEGVEMEVA